MPPKRADLRGTYDFIMIDFLGAGVGGAKDDGSISLIFRVDDAPFDLACSITSAEQADSIIATIQAARIEAFGPVT